MIFYTAETYIGRKVDRFNHIFGTQIVARDAFGKRKYVFITPKGRPTPCLKLWEAVAHYKTGLNKSDTEIFHSAWERTKEIAEELNEDEQENFSRFPWDRNPQPYATNPEEPLSF